MADKRDLERLQKQAAQRLNLNEAQFNAIIQREYVKSLKAIRAEMSEIYEKYSKEGVLTNAEMTKFNRLKNLEKEISKTMTKSGKEIAKKLNKYDDVIYDDAFFRYAWATDQASGVALEWGSPGQIREIENLKNIGESQYLQAIKSLNESGIKRVNNAIISGIMQGKSLKNMMKDVKDSLGSQASNAKTIIRTETHRLTELAHYEAYRKARSNGVKMTRKLIATLDDRTRPQSAAMDGDLSNDQGLFQYPDGQYYIPGSTGNPAWDINDRERTIEIIDGYTPTLRRTREEGIIPFQTFGQWAKDKNLTKNIFGQKLF